jgi:hypothetical protein
MSVSEALDMFRAAVPGCHLVAFVDLESSMVLSVSTQIKQRQELLSALGESASCHLPMKQDSLSKCLSIKEESAPPDVAVLLSATGTVAFVRSLSEPNEALCCGCSPNVAVDAIIDRARATLNDMEAAE